MQMRGRLVCVGAIRGQFLARSLEWSAPVSSKSFYGELSQLPRGIARDHGIRRHVGHDDRAASHDAALPDRDARHDDGSFADPNVVFDDDGFHFVARRGSTGHSRRGIRRVARRIKDPDIFCNFAVASNRNLFPNRETTVVSNSGVVTNEKCRVRGEASGKGKTALAVDQNIVSDDNFTAALYPMKINASMQISAITGTVRLEERFTEQDSDNEKVNRTQR